MPRTRSAQAHEASEGAGKAPRRHPDETLTPAERRLVALGRRELASGQFVTLERLTRELGGSPGQSRGARRSGRSAR